jgi:hypothetical protein
VQRKVGGAGSAATLIDVSLRYELPPQQPQLEDSAQRGVSVPVLSEVIPVRPCAVHPSSSRTLKAPAR